MITACVRKAMGTHRPHPFGRGNTIGPRAHRSRDPLTGKSLWENAVEEGGERFSLGSPRGPGALISAWEKIF